MINWLYTQTLDLSLLLGLILILRPVVRRLIGANAAYALWVLPLAEILVPEITPRTSNLIDRSIQDGSISALLNNSSELSDVFYIPSYMPIVEFWAIGFCLFALIRLFQQSRFIQLLTLDSVPLEFKEERLRGLIQQSGLDKRQVNVSDQITAPLVTGLAPPKIYVPIDFATEYEEEEQYWALRHEIGHLERFDLWFQLVAEILRTIFWFNPVVHLAISCFREDQEIACDQSILAECNEEERIAYGKALLRGSSIQLVPSLLLFFTKSKERYIMLENHKKSKLEVVATLALCGSIGVFTLTSAPVSVAQSDARPTFDDVYDAELTKKFTGKISRVDYGEFYMLLHVDAEQQDGTVTKWVVEGGSYKEMHDAGLDSNALYPGRYVTITGYQSKDQACNPACKLNGRDISFEN